MRKELEEIAIIDAYLDGTLEGSDKHGVELRIQNDAAFSEKVEAQKLFRQAIRRNALRKEIKAVKGNGNYGYFLGGALLLLIAVASFAYYFSNEPGSSVISESKAVQEKVIEVQDSKNEVLIEEDTTSVIAIEELPQNTEEDINITENKPAAKKEKDTLFDFNGLKTWIEPEVQTFEVDPRSGGLIEGKHGMVISIPSEAFVDQDGSMVKSDVRMELVEAFDLEKMVIYNLFTTSGKNALRSGGMFYLKAFAGNKELQMAPGKEMMIRVPTEEMDNEMKLFLGEVNNGKVDWKDPQPMKKYLITVPQEELNFLPEEYEILFQEKGKQLTGKDYSEELEDSVYYTLDRNYEYVQKKSSIKNLLPKVKIAGRDSKVYFEASEEFEVISTPEKSVCGVNSTSIQTILEKEFAQTYLSTKEFEERLQYLHSSNNGESMLQVYINGLNEDLWKSDEKVQNLIDSKHKEVFQNFASEKLTNTKASESHQQNWSKYFESQNRLARKKQHKLIELYKRGNEEKLAEARKAYKKEIRANGQVYQTNNTARRNISVAFAPLSSQSNNYTFGWANFGWTNIDAYLKRLDKNSKKVDIIVEGNQEGVQEVYQYLNIINTLTPLIKNQGKCVAMFPENDRRMRTTYAMTLQKVQGRYYWDFATYNPYETDSLALVPLETSITEVRHTLRKYGIEQDVVKRLAEEEERIKKQILENQKRREEAEKRAEALAEAKTEYDSKVAEIQAEIDLRNEFRMAAYSCGATFSDERVIREVPQSRQDTLPR